jgi:uncharacterized protein YggE
MMIKRVAILVLALLPVGANAQGGPPRGLPAAQGMPPSAAPSAGITVIGHGSVRVPVRIVTFAAMTRGNADEASVLAAMRAAGIVDPSMGPPGSMISANQATMLRGTIPGATEAKLDQVGSAAAAYVRQHPGLTIENISVAPRLDDCGTPEQTARTAAFADARRKGEAIAALAGLSIDGVESVNESGGCLAPDLPQFGPANGFDLGTLTTSVSVNEVVTFIVSPAPSGARRRTL